MLNGSKLALTSRNAAEAIPSNSDSKLELATRVLDDYVLVRKSDPTTGNQPSSDELYKAGLNKPALISPDERKLVQVPLPTSVGAATRIASSTARGRGKMKAMRTTLCVRYLSSAAANTALATVTGLTPTSSSEWSAFFALYDEYMVNAVKVRSLVGATNGGAQELAVWAYDPVGTGALGATVDGCVYSQHLLCPAVASSSLIVGPQVATPGNGLFDFHIKVPKGGFVADSAVPTNVVGAWSATSSTDTCGYLKRYIPALGAGIASQILEVAFFDVTFRNRQ